MRSKSLARDPTDREEQLIGLLVLTQCLVQELVPVQNLGLSIPPKKKTGMHSGSLHCFHISGKRDVGDQHQHLHINHSQCCQPSVHLICTCEWGSTSS